MGALNRTYRISLLLLCTISTITLFPKATHTPTGLPKRIKIRTSDEFNQSLSELAQALNKLAHGTHTLAVHTDWNKAQLFCTTLCISVVGCTLALLSIPLLLKTTSRCIDNPTKAHMCHALLSGTLCILGINIIHKSVPQKNYSVLSSSE